MDTPDGVPQLDEDRILAALEEVDDELAQFGSLLPVLEAHDVVGDDAMRFAVVRSLRTAQTSAADDGGPSGGDGDLPPAVREAVPLLASQWILGCAVASAARPPLSPVDTPALVRAAHLVDGSTTGSAAEDATTAAPRVDVAVVRNVASDRAAVVVAAQRATGVDVDPTSAVGFAAAFVDGFMIGLAAAAEAGTAL